MTPRLSTVIAVASVLALGAAGWLGLEHRVASAATARQHETALARALSDHDVREREIAMFATLAHEDTMSAFARSELAARYLQRAREMGDFQDYLRAEEAARRSLLIRSSHNAQAFVTLASTLLAQHRFTDALAVAEDLVSRDSEAPAYRALLGEIQLELGDYAGAHVTLDSLRRMRNTLAGATRLARWAELTGQNEAARRVIRSAGEEAIQLDHLPREQVAWFYLRMGELQMRDGRLRPAEIAFREGLEVHPGDHRLLAASARLEAVRHDWKKAISYGEQAITKVLDPAPLGILSDAYAMLGDTAKSEEYYRAMEVAFLNQPGAYHRAWSLFLLDHDRHTSAVLARARDELRTRRDIYGYDLLAWALHKDGRNAEAREAMLVALRQGTQDAMLYYHAGMIERAAGNREAARLHLQRALSVNPYFHHTQPAVARATLDSLAREASTS